MTNSAPIIVVSGRIASGKTTFAEALATRLGFSKTGFGEEVRARARAKGLADSREVMQALGAELVVNDPEEFCRAVLDRGGFESGQGMVVDGIRHTEILALLRRIVSPRTVIHVHVDSADEVRHARLQERMRAGEIDLAKADAHSTEVQVSEKLPAIADIRVDGSDELDEMLRATMHALGRR